MLKFKLATDFMSIFSVKGQWNNIYQVPKTEMVKNNNITPSQ